MFLQVTTFVLLCNEDWPDNRRWILRIRKETQSFEQCHTNAKMQPCLVTQMHVRGWLSSGTCESYIWSCVLHHNRSGITKMIQTDSEVHLIARVCSHWNQKLHRKRICVQDRRSCRLSENLTVSCLSCSLRNEDGNFGSNKLLLNNPCDFIERVWMHQIIFPDSCRFTVCGTRWQNLLGGSPFCYHHRRSKPIPFSIQELKIN